MELAIAVLDLICKEKEDVRLKLEVGQPSEAHILYTIQKTHMYIYVYITALDFPAASGDEFVFYMYCTLKSIFLFISIASFEINL